MHFIKIIVHKKLRYIDIEGADICLGDSGGVFIYINGDEENQVYIEPENAIRLIRHLDMISANVT